MTSYLYDGWQVHDFFEIHVSSVAPRTGVHVLTLLPFTVWNCSRSEPVSAVVVATMFARAVFTPPVIGDHLILKKNRGNRPC